ncbi:cytochrome c [Marinobacter lutaoensis]|jgi:cytochrome c556|uniref:Cytochrome C n=1 Tax=Marinobacter lutaoensis TaxID=135739 RepID=A0A1V2DWN7_9GAMM|nr:cytochrome c [Marinobacter lutaoensis]MBE02089.1 cytochrome C [Marinobacter sp.]MBI41917.1 cytochrome C [Oceanospirillales bacterium]NVD36504.1 cytochrome c [Marinobacter lutaoensis]ONF44870.1 cytochrome C [Marinobacter lutaoensis]|tara:strand:- start:423 stop:887 length:465 start_codon:yes stop_codon:yes gene_type:complete
MKRSGIATAYTFAACLASPALAQMSVEDQIETRQAAFQFAAWNMGKIKAQVVDGSVAYNPEQMQAAANAVAAVANSGLGSLFGPGTGMDQADGTKLKPAFFDEPDKAREIAIRFAQEASKLQAVARAGDADALAQQFRAVGQSCKACHDRYRAK